MFTLIIGGAASGKSAYAETLVQRLPGAKQYIATMQPFDGECRERIAKHRAMRQNKGFTTRECYTGLSAVRVPQGANVLLECMSNLVANERYSPGGNGAEEALKGVRALLPQCGNLTVVTNEVFSGGMDYEGETPDYMRELAHINRELAAWADTVIEVVCGLPNFLKAQEQI